MSYDVFISYSSADKLTADAVCATLESRGMRCWIAPRDIVPGQDWSDAIIDGLTSARVFVLLLSATSNASEQVKREVQNAVSEGLSIIPFRLEDVALSKHMRYFIGTPHWLDALTSPMEGHLERLSQTVHALLQAADQNEIDEVMLGDKGNPVPVPSAASSVALPGTDDGDWHPDHLRKIERELAAFMGPVARVLVHQAAMKTSDAEVLCQQVSKYVVSEAERKKFLDAVSRVLHHSKGGGQEANSATPITAPVLASWEPAVLQKIEQQFAAYIGPLARVLVKRTSQKTDDINEMYELLAENLTSSKERDQFLRGRFTA